jgi:hypothetical protein
MWEGTGAVVGYPDAPFQFPSADTGMITCALILIPAAVSELA